ncbi:MAG TPA: hypothetical protein VEB21_19965 [Terriglobales bacterium]|nr:hypothetical protein [Terriglobales bacterium]
MRASNSLAIGLLLAACFAGPAAAQELSKDEQKCVNFANKGVEKIASKHLMMILKCAAAYAKDKGVANIEECAAPAVAAVLVKVEDGAAAKCEIWPTWPDIPGEFYYRAVTPPFSLTSNLFGSFETGLRKCSDDPEGAGCKCQGTVLKTTAKLFNFYLKGFNKCTKSGLKAAGTEQIVDTDGLLACLIDPAEFDPKAKHAKLLEKSTSALAKGCAPIADPLPDSYECAGKRGEALALCLDQRTRCQVCAMINDVDGMSNYPACDTFDDGIENMSCFGA